jgi:hypothetical protein
MTEGVITDIEIFDIYTPKNGTHYNLRKLADMEMKCENENMGP